MLRIAGISMSIRRFGGLQTTGVQRTQSAEKDRQRRRSTDLQKNSGLSGDRFEHENVLFSLDDSGALADRWSAGTVGGLFLRRFTLVFDYPHRRVGFAAPANE